MIDLRSDTITRPGRETREAMARVEVGDDVYGEDPTVNLLQERAAAAGLHAPEHGVDRLAEDHENARRLATLDVDGSQVDRAIEVFAEALA